MKLPLLKAACHHTGKDFLPLHTPGHKGKWKLPHLDTIELLAGADIADDIGNFPDALNASEEAAAEIYGTLRTFYLVNGSTAGVQAMFLSAAKPGEKVIAGRNLHVSAISALVMTGAVPVYVPLALDNDGINLNVLPEDVIATVEKNPDAQAVFLTSPSYFCVCTKLSQIASACHQRNIPLLVDEAWGGHFPFSRNFPRSALETGADLAVHGVHKTMPSLTGTALLHVNSDRIDELLVSSSLRMVETTSPNVLMYLSIEYAIQLMKTRGVEILDKACTAAEKVTRIMEEKTVFKHGFPKEKNRYHDAFSFDPIKLMVRTAYQETGITGYDVGRFISEKHKVYAEMTDLETILFLFTGFEDDKAEERLARALIDASDTLCRVKRKAKKIPLLSELEKPAISLIPRDAFFAPGELVSLSAAPGRVLQTAVVPYPPGIPLLMPGETATGNLIDYIREILDSGGNVRGIIQADDDVLIRVVK
jgi:arginine decarboxylase